MRDQGTDGVYHPDVARVGPAIHELDPQAHVGGEDRRRVPMRHHPQVYDERRTTPVRSQP